jgi:hypothetical protein
MPGKTMSKEGRILLFTVIAMLIAAVFLTIKNSFQHNKKNNSNQSNASITIPFPSNNINQPINQNQNSNLNP